MENYYKIPEEIVASSQRKKVSNHLLEFVKTGINTVDPTISEIWVINVGCGEEYFTWIDWSILPIIQLEITDFPIAEGFESAYVTPDYTPPASNGYGIIIPEKFQWCFPITVDGYIVVLKTDSNDVKYCEASGLTWTGFINEMDKSKNANLKASLFPIWEYAIATTEILVLT